MGQNRPIRLILRLDWTYVSAFAGDSSHDEPVWAIVGGFPIEEFDAVSG